MRKKEKLQKVDVYYRPESEAWKVGSLIQKEQQIYFIYDSEFLSKNGTILRSKQT